jgi:hypothetical protein
MHTQPTEDNFCEEHGKAQKPVIVEDYIEHVGYVDKGYRMSDSYVVSQSIWKWTKNCIFTFLM